MPLAAVAGSLVGGVLPGTFSGALGVPLGRPAPYRYPLLLVGLFFLIGLLVTLATRKVRREQERRTTSQADDPATDQSRAGALPLALLGTLGVVMALRTTGEWAANTFFNVYMDAGLHAPTLLIGRVAAAVQLVAGFATLAMPILVGRWGKERVIGLGSVAVALSLLPWALIPHWAAAGVGYMGAIAVATIVTAAIFVFGQELVSPHWQAVMSGVVWMGMGVGGAAIVIGGGHLIERYGYASVFLTAAAVTAVGGLLFLAYFRVPRGELGRPAQLEVPGE
jgi:Na+/melibiose symporter-like transporter